MGCPHQQARAPRDLGRRCPSQLCQFSLRGSQSSSGMALPSWLCGPRIQAGRALDGEVPSGAWMARRGRCLDVLMVQSCLHLQQRAFVNGQHFISTLFRSNLLLIFPGSYYKQVCRLYLSFK